MPRASAVAGSIEANMSGRPIVATAATQATATTVSATTWPVVTPRKLPNRRAFVPSRLPW